MKNKEIKGLKTKNLATAFAILAAALYAINVPISKLLLTQVEPTMMAAFLYLGAGFGLMLYGLVQKMSGKGQMQERLTKRNCRIQLQWWFWILLHRFC